MIYGLDGVCESAEALQSREAKTVRERRGARPCAVCKDFIYEAAHVTRARGASDFFDGVGVPLGLGFFVVTHTRMAGKGNDSLARVYPGDLTPKPTR